MFAIDFEYAGEKLSDYNMVVCSFGGTEGFEIVSSGAEITFSQAKPKGSNNFKLYSATYDTPFTASFSIMKNSCGVVNDDDLILSFEEISAIQRWLCRKSYNRFKIDQDGYRKLNWNATFSSKQINMSGRCVGLELTLVTDAPWAYLDEVVVSYDFYSGHDIMTIFDSSDEIGYIHPNLTITLAEDGYGANKVLRVTNAMDNKIMELKGCVIGEVIKIDGRNQIISSSIPDHKVAKDFNYYFPKVINTYDETQNDFTTNVDCTIELSYFPIKKVGL